MRNRTQGFLLMTGLLLITACSVRSPNLPASDPMPVAPTDTLAQPEATPILRIDPGTHYAAIRQIDVDAAERFVVTASYDKTARVWDLATGKLLKTLHPPIGEGNEGLLYAVAISPDGGVVAVSGRTSKTGLNETIYIFERSSGVLLARIPGLPTVVNHLAFSPDGDKLAVALGDSGIRLFSSRNWREMARDTNYGDSSYSVDFDSGGRLVSTSFDGFVRLYDADLTLLAHYQTQAGSQPFYACFSPDGKQIAVGFDDSPALEILAADGLQPVFRPDPDMFIPNGNLGTVAWARDGKSLYAGGAYTDGKGCSLMVWYQAGAGRRVVWRVLQNTVVDIKPLKDGGVIVGTADPGLLRLDAQGRIIWKQLSGTLAFNWLADRLAFSVSGDASAVQLAYAKEDDTGAVQHSQALWQVATLQLAQAGSILPLQTPLRAAPRLNITFWPNEHPKLNGQPLPLRKHEEALDFAIDSRGDSFALGTNWYLYLFNKDGSALWSKPVSVPTALSVKISADDQWLVAALGDGSVRWYEKQTGNERLAFYLHPDEQRWIAWTPQGFYATSPGAESLIGYHLNRGADKEAEFVGVDQLRTVFARADLVSQALSDDYPLLAQEALQQAGDVRQILHAGLPPKVEIAGGLDRALKGREFELDFTLLDQGGGIGRVEYRLNGEVVSSAVGRPLAPRSPAGQQRFRRPFALVNGENIIQVIAYSANDKLAAKPETLKVLVDDPVQREPSLYVLSIGVTNYRDQQSFGLKYAADDAVAFAEALQSQQGRLFRNVYPKVLKDNEATLANIHSAFQEIAEQAQPQDVFVLYLAGHGVVVDGRYHFVPQEVIYENDAVIRDKALSEEKLRDWLALVEVSKRMTVIDSCHAGKALTTLASLDQPMVRGVDDKAAIGRLMQATGSSVLAAASSQQQALEGIVESGSRGHGLLTYVLLKGLQGSADIIHKDNVIDVEELQSYARSEVPRLSKQRWQYEQFPMFQLNGQDFPIAQIRQ